MNPKDCTFVILFYHTEYFGTLGRVNVIHQFMIDKINNFKVLINDD